LKKRILITDDHTIVRRGVVSLLKEHFSFFELYEAESYKETIDQLKSQKMDLLILDLNLPDANAENLVLQIKKDFAALPIIVFSMFPKEVMELPMQKLGVNVYINKSENLLKLRDAIDAIFLGKKKQATSVEGLHKVNPFEHLSPKELSVMFSLLEGHSNAQICTELNLKASTISTFKQRIFQKLGIQSTAELVKIAMQFNVYHLSEKSLS
jgi:DNA-binding NarL/FixJ family response regulator